MGKKNRSVYAWMLAKDKIDGVCDTGYICDTGGMSGTVTYHD